MSNIVGQRIKSIREELGLTMGEFGKVLDGYKVEGKIKSGTVSNWETGKNLPNKNRLRKIAELGNTTVESLIKTDTKYCDTCKYDQIQNNYKFCPICGKKQ